MMTMGEDNEYTGIPILRKTKERQDKLMQKDQNYDEFQNLLLDLFEKGHKK